jgi:esterase/lipase superfamily enzyme
VPAHHKEGQIELSASPAKGFAVTRPPAEFSRTGFIRSIEDHLQRRTGVEFPGHVFIFVHGYNTRYEEAVLRMAQLLNDSETRETSVLFAWPSFGKYVRYSADRERSLQSRDELEHLLDGIAGSTAVERVHIVAHSMGSMLAMETLRQIAFKRKSEVLRKLGAITLVAPDVDVEVFKSQLTAIGGLSGHVVAVVAKDDLAIGLSNRLVGGMPRLGNLDVENRKNANSQRIVAALCQKDVKIISLRNISGCDSTGHSGYACVIRKLRKEVPAAQACADNVVSGLE